MILAGDVGGTNTRLALFNAAITTPAVMEVFPSREHSGLEEILRKFRSLHSQPIEAASFGIAGPVYRGRSETPNLPWVVDSAELANELRLETVNLVNDLEANAQGISVLAPDDFCTLQAGAADASGNRALISAGTGLGEAGLLATERGYRPLASEGGHADFAPRNATEIQLLEYLLDRFDHVSYERVLSGPGLYNLYQFFRDTSPGEHVGPVAEEIRNSDDPPAAIAELALTNGCELCVKALDLFVTIYGAEAGNLALRTVAIGGVFLGGGIAPKILAKLKEPRLLAAFNAKGRSSRLLEAIPVRVILNDMTALLGAARLAQLG